MPLSYLKSIFHSSYLNKCLRYKDVSFEKNFKKTKNKFQLLNYKFLCTMLLVFLLSDFLTFFFTSQHFELETSLPLLVGLVLLISGYIIVIKKLRQRIDFVYTLTVICFVIGNGELVFYFLVQNGLGPSSYLLLGVQIQTASLLMIIARIHWVECFFGILVSETYILSFVFRLDKHNSPLATSIVTFLFYLISLPFMIYCSEYEDRKRFLEIQLREESLRAFENLIKNVLPSSIVLFDAKDVIFFNKKSRDMFGVQSENELLALFKNLEVVRESSSNFKKINEKAVDDNQMLTFFDLIKKWTFGMEKKIHKPSVEFVYFEAKFINEKSQTPERTFAIQLGYTLWEGKYCTMIIINDISTIKNYYKELADHKDHLLSTVSHELKTPLNGILGMLEVAIEETMEEKNKSYLEVIQTSSKLLLNMINDILDFSLLSKGKLVLNFECIDIIKLVEDAIKLLQPQALMKNLSIKLEHQVENQYLKIDPSRIRQILLNLIANAIKFTEKGHVIIRLVERAINDYNINEKFSVNEDQSCCERYSERSPVSSNNYLEGEKLRIYTFEFEDTGIGMSKKDQSSLFELFLKDTKENDPDFNKSGVGLGLTISQGLVKALNKASKKVQGISVTSQVGIGTKFSFELMLYGKNSNHSSEEFPLFSMNEPAVNKPKSIGFSSNNLSQNKELIPESLNLKKELKVLAVDDDQINHVVLKNYIILHNKSELKFLMTQANNGKEALEVIEKKASEGNYFDLILMDCNMPIMDGFEATRLIRKKIFEGVLPEVPIVAITANVNNSDKKFCKKAGMDYFLAKPLKKADLMTTIRKALKTDKNKALSLPLQKR